MTSTCPRLITRAELRSLVPYTQQHILRLEKQGKFPRRIRLGENRVAWLEADVRGWIEARVKARDEALALAVAPAAGI